MLTLHRAALCSIARYCSGVSLTPATLVFGGTCVIRFPAVCPLAYLAPPQLAVSRRHTVDSLGMPQFGAGPDLAAQCTPVATPGGWRAWTDADGPIPADLAQRAQALAADQSVALGATESYPLPGVTTLIVIEPRVWSRDAQGNLIQGCFRVGGIYLPSGTAPQAVQTVTPPDPNAPSSSLAKTIAILTAASLAVGTAATIATWNRR